MHPNLEVRFLPGDRDSRIRFLDQTLFLALDRLRKDQEPSWGRMTPQQMVEHLIWSFELSIGTAQTACLVSEERMNQIRPFIFNDQPNPRDFQHPSLASGLPPLRHGDLAASVSALRTVTTRFLEQYDRSPDVPHMHPLFGPIGSEAWSRLHYKHGHHHLLQFALIREPSPASA